MREEEDRRAAAGPRCNGADDHFLAFDNAYAFIGIGRTMKRACGPLPAGIGGAREISVHAVATLVEPPLSESTTFWKAIYSGPSISR